VIEPKQKVVVKNHTRYYLIFEVEKDGETFILHIFYIFPRGKNRD